MEREILTLLTRALWIFGNSGLIKCGFILITDNGEAPVATVAGVLATPSLQVLLDNIQIRQAETWPDTPFPPDIQSSVEEIVRRMQEVGCRYTLTVIHPHGSVADIVVLDGEFKEANGWAAAQGAISKYAQVPAVEYLSPGCEIIQLTRGDEKITLPILATKVKLAA